MKDISKYIKEAAIESNRLSLKEKGKKYWYNYKLNITFLYWSRNLFEGYQIDISRFTNNHLGRVLYGR